MSLYFLVSYWQFGVFLPSSSCHLPSVHVSLFTLHSFYKHTCLIELEAHPTPVPDGSEGKVSHPQYRRHRRCRFNPWVGKIPWRRKWQPTPYSCLKNPIDRGAWQSTVQWVAESPTQLKWLSLLLFQYDLNLTYILSDTISKCGYILR